MSRKGTRPVPHLERAVAILLMVLLSPLLIVLVVWVKIVSPGPSLFISERIGADGKPFNLYKLRTMIPGAVQIVNEDLHTLVSGKDDRIIPGGVFLRKGFDELFQLLNVAAGTMRFIGPRPDLPWMKERYLPEVLPRVSVPPGITGWSQISGGRDLTTRQGYLLDLWYVRNRSWRLDFRIFLWTPLYILVGVALPEKVRERCLSEMADVGKLFLGDGTEDGMKAR